MSLLDRKTSILVLDKRICYNESIFSSVYDWREAQDALKSYYVKHHAKCEAHKRESLTTYQQKKQYGTNNEEEDDSGVNDDDDNILSFETSESVDNSIANNNLSEDELKIKYSAAASYENNRVVCNWIACKVPWKNA